MMSLSTIIPDDVLISLASGREDPEVTKFLIKGQLGKRLLQLGKITGQFGVSDARRVGGEDFELLAVMHRHSPDTVNSLLLDPDVGAWLNGGERGRVFVGLIAAAAAIRTGMRATIAAPVDEGRLYLPTLGTAILTHGDSCGDATLRIRPDVVEITAGGTAIELPSDLETVTQHWRPIPRLTLGTGTKLRVLLDYDGPLRESFGREPIVEAPEDADGHGRYQSLVEAWHILERHHPASAEAISAGLRVIVPDFTPEKRAVSGTISGIFGGVLIGLPSRPLAIACNLVHEFQHAKLAALQDLVSLHRPDGRPLYYAPWRYDPRPLPAFLQGIYAHLGVALFWNAQRHASDESRSTLSDVEFARWRQDTWQACKPIVDDDHFTPVGRRFVGMILERLTDLCAEDVPTAAAAIAARITRDHELTWRLHNFELDPRLAHRLANLWLSGERNPPLPEGSVCRRTIRSNAKGERIPLMYATLFGEQQEVWNVQEAAADLSYVNGDYNAALVAYAGRVVSNPHDLNAWAGLVLSAAELRGHQGEALMAVAEITPAVFSQATLQCPGIRDPLKLMQWLADVA